MKRKLFALLLIPFVLSSCQKQNGSGNKAPTVDDAIIDKASFEYECNPDTVVFKSNYRIEHFYNGASQLITDIDYGKAISGGYYYYHVDKGDYVETTTYSSGYPNTQTRTKQQFYEYWFQSYAFFFELKYEDFTYNEANKYYALNKPISSHGFNITGGYLRAKNKKPIEYKFDIENYGEFKGQFSKFGEISITLPTVEIKTQTLYYTYQDLEPGLSLSTAINRRIGSFGIPYQFELLDGDIIKLTITYKTIRDISLIKMAMATYGQVTFSNAHNTTAYLPGKAFAIDFTIHFPYQSGTAFYNMLKETILDYEYGQEQYGEYYQDGEGEDSTSSYKYYLYLWLNYDERCLFPGYEYTNLLGKIDVGDACEKGDPPPLEIYVSPDIDGDCYATSQEALSTYEYCQNLAILINSINDEAKFELYTYGI